jgi:hypothetical protein
MTHFSNDLSELNPNAADYKVFDACIAVKK